MNQLRKALELAYEKHKNQVDKAGKPYFLHPVMVALNDGLEEKEKIVAILHDIIEDTDITEKDLLDIGFDDDIVEAVVLLTRDKNMTYYDYIRKIKYSNNTLAYWVKMADLEDNMDLSRLKNATDKDKERVKRYQKAVDILVSNCD